MKHLKKFENDSKDDLEDIKDMLSELKDYGYRISARKDELFGFGEHIIVNIELDIPEKEKLVGIEMGSPTTNNPLDISNFQNKWKTLSEKHDFLYSSIMESIDRIKMMGFEINYLRLDLESGSENFSIISLYRGETLKKYHDDEAY